MAQLKIDKLQEVYDLADSQLAKPGDQSCYEQVKLSAQDSIDTAIFMKAPLPTGVPEDDAATLSNIDTLVELLMEKYTQCDATLTTLPASKTSYS